MTTIGLRALPALSDRDARDLRSRVIFELGKFDPQCGDIDVVCPFALALDQEVWQLLSHDAELLASELLAAEGELLTRPDLHHHLALPRRIRRTLARARKPAAAREPRVVRFDFHPTTAGWLISEANNDVPGGFIESSGLAAIFLRAESPVPPPRARELGRGPAISPTVQATSGLVGSDHPPPTCSLSLLPSSTTALITALTSRTRAGDTVGLIHATAYTDDRQVMLHFARHLAAHNRDTILLAPEQTTWPDARPHAHTAWRTTPLDALIRFFPAEWLANLPHSHDLAPLFTSTAVPFINPASALLTQSKRLPLLFPQLKTPMPTWQRLLPETRDPRHTPRPRGHHPDWILKPALGRVGDGVTIPSITPAHDIRRSRRSARLLPRHWIAQRRFYAIPIDTPRGPRYPCLGVYVIDGSAAGIYGRLAARPLIDSHAQDVAVLLSTPTPLALRTSTHVHLATTPARSPAVV